MTSTAESRAYTPSRISTGTTEDIQNDVERELWSISEAIQQSSERLIPNNAYVEPERPFHGQIIYAPAGPGEWDPFAGAGYYIYTNGEWLPMWVGIGAVVIEKGENEFGRYIVWNDGFIELYMATINVPASSTVTLPYPKALTERLLTFTLASVDGSNNPSAAVFDTVPSLTECVIRNTSNRIQEVAAVTIAGF